MRFSTTDLYQAFAETKALIQAFPVVQADFAPVNILFEVKRSNPELSVMVYGIYNAGKSTLINALLGKEVAPTGDVPLTDKVGTYQWNNHSILDTPGVDAPAEHEQVTNQQMLKADAIIFVVNPTGAAEESKTLQKLVDLLAERKKVFLVFNEKNQLAAEDFIRLKNDTRIRLQSMAAARGLDNILADIPIMRVNAARALKGKLTDKSALVEHSGLPALEQALDSFFAKISSDDVNTRLAVALQDFLLGVNKLLTESGSSEQVNKYNQLRANLLTQQSQCQQVIEQTISSNSALIYDKTKSVIHQNPNGCTPIMEQVYQQAAADVTSVIDSEITYLLARFNDEIDTLISFCAESQPSDCDFDAQQLVTPAQGDTEETSKDKSNSGLNRMVINQGVESVKLMAKPEHIIESLKLVKRFVPSVMKGVGPKTMEKLGAQVVSKWIPYVGTAVTVITGIWDIFAEDPEEKKMREQSEKMRRDHERFLQEVDDMAKNLARQFEQAMQSIISSDIKPKFIEMLQQVDTALKSANEQQQTQADAIVVVQGLIGRVQVC